MLAQAYLRVCVSTCQRPHQREKKQTRLISSERHRFSRHSLKELTTLFEACQPQDCECKIKHFLPRKTRKIKVSPDHFAVGNSRENYAKNLVFKGG